MKKTSHGGKEIVGRLQFVVGSVELVSSVLGPSFLSMDGVEQREPLREVVIAETAGALLDVGLDVEDGVAVAGMPRARHFSQVLHDHVPLAQDHRGQ
jgi:hypothetical protein